MTDIKRTIMKDADCSSGKAMERIAMVCGRIGITSMSEASDEQRELILEHGIANTLPPVVAVSLDVIPQTEEQWQTCLADARDRSKSALRDYCVRIYQYKESCEEATFCKTAVDLLKISESQAIKMALVGADEHIRSANVEDLPPSLETLYLTTTLPEEKKQEAFESGAINAKTTRAAVQEMKRPKPVARPTVIPTHSEDAEIIPPDDPEAVEVTFEELADEPGVDSVAEALEEAGLPPLDEVVPDYTQMPVIGLDRKLSPLNAAQKKAVRAFIKREVSAKVQEALPDAIKKAEKRIRDADIDLRNREDALRRGNVVHSHVEFTRGELKLIRGQLHQDRGENEDKRKLKSYLVVDRVYQLMGKPKAIK